MTPLLKLELRRQRPFALKMALLSAVVCAVFFAAGKRAPADLLAVVLGSGLGAVLIVPMGISRDKMEGTLDFLCGLPVEPRAIAASRFAAMAILAAPWAIAAGVVSIALPVTVQVNPGAVTVLTLLVLLVIGACSITAFACWELEALLGAPFVALVIAFVLAPRVARALLPGLTRDAALHFVQTPSAPLLIALCLLVAGGVVGAIAFGMTTRGFANYRADPARR
jgi:ABC-type transport system involved in multi-copper enzyme maturation permease subunit